MLFYFLDGWKYGLLYALGVFNATGNVMVFFCQLTRSLCKLVGAFIHLSLQYPFLFLYSESAVLRVTYNASGTHYNANNVEPCCFPERRNNVYADICAYEIPGSIIITCPYVQYVVAGWQLCITCKVSC